MGTTKRAENSMLDRLAAVTEAVESGAGLAAITRAAGSALGASLAVIDRRSAVVAVAAASPEDERRLLAGEGGTESHELRVADEPVGTLRLRMRDDTVPDALAMRMVTTLLALEVERALAPERADQQVAAGLIDDLVSGAVKDGRDVAARIGELGVGLADGCAFVLVRAAPRKPLSDDWRGRLALVVERTARSLNPRALAATVERPGVKAGEVFVLVPGLETESVAKAAAAIAAELASGFSGFQFTIGHSRVTTEAGDMFRTCQEALLAANVADASGGDAPLAFEATGAYRLLLPAMCDDPGELRSFFAETIRPLVEYDEQYETDLVRTVETFLAADANVAGTAQRLFTHRHTIRYRLERVRDLTGLDCSSTDGREKLSLGLKAMRVLGIADPGGPAFEPGTEGGRVPG
jgi:DNA-binding PucR family transcriptional regulator